MKYIRKTRLTLSLILVLFLPTLVMASEVNNVTKISTSSAWKKLRYSGSKYYIKATMSVEESVLENEEAISTSVETRFLHSRRTNTVISRYDGTTLSEISIRHGKKPKYRETKFTIKEIVHKVQKPRSIQEASMGFPDWSSISVSTLEIPKAYHEQKLYSPESIFFLVGKHIQRVGDQFSFVVPNKKEFLEIELEAKKMISVEKKISIEGGNSFYTPEFHLVVVARISNNNGDEVKGKFLNCDGPLLMYKELNYNLITEITCTIKPLGKITLNLDQFLPKT